MQPTFAALCHVSSCIARRSCSISRLAQAQLLPWVLHHAGLVIRLHIKGTLPPPAHTPGLNDWFPEQQPSSLKSFHSCGDNSSSTIWRYTVIV